MIERQWDPKAHVEFLPHIKMCRKIEKDRGIKNEESFVIPRVNDYFFSYEFIMRSRGGC